MRLFSCQSCSQLLYFENRLCQHCQHQLGYVPETGTLAALEPEGEDWRTISRPDHLYRFCENAALDACNWLIRADSQERFCASCRHNRTIPDLGVGTNLTRWRKFELAKHRLFYTLIRLKLPLVNRTDDPESGLAFDFVDQPPAGPKVITGHESGLITINLVEADDDERERVRLAMSEPYRTMLGHLRHESGHYFWDRLVRDDDCLESWREIFGDERQDYAQTLQSYYANGPQTGWQESYISAYASSHPWEDFAETWAHYLHIVDTLEMAFAFGMHIRPRIASHSGVSAKLDFDPHKAGDIHRLIDAWLPLTFAMNSINRCMGEKDLYPFVLSNQVVAKMEFVHQLMHSDRKVQKRADAAPEVLQETR
jgi:hypothetical protein